MNKIPYVFIFFYITSRKIDMTIFLGHTVYFLEKYRVIYQIKDNQQGSMLM